MRKSDNAQTKFSEVFAESNSELQLDNTTLQGVLEDSLRSVIAKTYGSDENYSFIINPAKGDFLTVRWKTLIRKSHFQRRVRCKTTLRWVRKLTRLLISHRSVVA